MKGTKTKATTGATKTSTKAGATASSSGQRNTGTASNIQQHYQLCLTLSLPLGKNSKEAFLKKLQLCMKHYDYKDETKDVRGKVRTIISIAIGCLVLINTVCGVD